MGHPTQLCPHSHLEENLISTGTRKHPCNCRQCLQEDSHGKKSPKTTPSLMSACCSCVLLSAGKFMKHCEEVITKDAEGPVPSISGLWCGERCSETSALAAYFMPSATVRKSSSSFQLHFQESGLRSLIPPSRPGTERASGLALCSTSPAHFLLLCLPAVSCPPLLSQEALKMAWNLMKHQTASVTGNLSCRALSLSLLHT